MKWFRFYHEFVDDPKIAMMSDSDQLLWVKALCLASESKERGVIKLTDEEICWKLRVTQEIWKHAIDKFRAKGMLEHCEDGYRIINWDKRQFKSDSSAERVAEHRSKSKPKDAPTKKSKVTSKKVERYCNVTSNNDVIPSDPDPDTDPDPDQITYTDPEPQPGQKACVRDSFNQTEPEDVYVCVERFNQSEQSEPDEQSFPVNPGTQTEILDRDKPIAVDQKVPPVLQAAPRQQYQSAAARCDRQFDPLPLWRMNWSANGIKPEFIKFVAGVYYPEQVPSAGGPVTDARAKSWIIKREFDLKGIAEIELAFDEFESRRQKANSVRSGNSTTTHIPASAPPQTLTEEEKARRKAGFERMRRTMNGAV